MKISCTKKITFDAAHRIPNHPKCGMLHGHTYTIEITFSILADNLNESGMVIDFTTIKHIVGNWIKKYWDHNVILCEIDNELGNNINKYTKQKVFFMAAYPTAENMAIFLMKKMKI